MLDFIYIWSRLAWKHWPEMGQMILAHQLASRPDPFGQNRTQSARTKPDPAWFCIKHPIRMGLEALPLARSRLDDTCTPDCFWTGSVWPKPDSQPEPNQIQPGFAQYDLGHLWKNTTEPESGKLVVGWLHSAGNWAWWFLHTGLLLDQMCLAQIWPGHPDQCFMQYGPGLLWKNSWTGCGKLDLAYMIRPNSGCTLAIMAVTGHNQNASELDPACLLGLYQVCALCPLEALDDACHQQRLYASGCLMALVLHWKQLVMGHSAWSKRGAGTFSVFLCQHLWADSSVPVSTSCARQTLTSLCVLKNPWMDDNL